MENKKYELSSDERLNPKLKEEVSSLRGGMLAQAEKNELPERFMVVQREEAPQLIIIDKQTGKESVVPMFAYGNVRKTLNDLFGEE